MAGLGPRATSIAGTSVLDGESWGRHFPLGDPCGGVLRRDILIVRVREAERTELVKCAQGEHLSGYDCKFMFLQDSSFTPLIVVGVPDVCSSQKKKVYFRMLRRVFALHHFLFFPPSVNFHSQESMQNSTMIRRCVTNAAIRGTAQAPTRAITSYAMFMKKVYKTKNYPELRAKILLMTNLPKRAKAMGKVFNAMPPAEKKALALAGSKIKSKKPVGPKMKYLKKMQTSPRVEGLKGAAKQKKLAVMWAKRQNLVRVC
jgi:hypothetical protein